MEILVVFDGTTVVVGYVRKREEGWRVSLRQKRFLSFSPLSGRERMCML